MASGGDLFNSVFVGFLANIGIDHDRRSFQDPIGWTSQLSAFIKISQILAILQAVAGADLAVVGFSAKLLDDMMDRFVVFSTRSPTKSLEGGPANYAENVTTD